MGFEASCFLSELIPKLAEMGFLGVIFPEAYGGAGMGYIEYSIIIEELSRVDGSVGIIMASPTILCAAIIFTNSARRRSARNILVPLAQGVEIGVLVSSPNPNRDRMLPPPAPPLSKKTVAG